MLETCVILSSIIEFFRKRINLVERKRGAEHYQLSLFNQNIYHYAFFLHFLIIDLMRVWGIVINLKEICFFTFWASKWTWVRRFLWVFFVCLHTLVVMQEISIKTQRLKSKFRFHAWDLIKINILSTCTGKYNCIDRYIHKTYFG